GWALTIAATCGSRMAVDRWVEMTMQKVLQAFTACLHVSDCPVMVTYRRGKQLSPLDDDHASPQFRWYSHGQVMTLSDREVPKPSLGLLGLPHIAETGTSDIDAIQRWPRCGRGRWMCFGQQRPDAMREGVTLLAPRVKALMVASQFLERTVPSNVGVGVKSARRRVIWCKDVRTLLCVGGHPWMVS